MFCLVGIWRGLRASSVSMTMSSDLYPYRVLLSQPCWCGHAWGSGLGRTGPEVARSRVGATAGVVGATCIAQKKRKDARQEAFNVAGVVDAPFELGRRVEIVDADLRGQRRRSRARESSRGEVCWRWGRRTRRAPEGRSNSRDAKTQRRTKRALRLPVQLEYWKKGCCIPFWPWNWGP